MVFRCRVRLHKNIFNSPSRLRRYSSLADTYHPKVSVLPFTHDVLTIQSKMDLLVPPLFGIGAAILGYAQMIFGPEVANAGIKRTQFKPVYIPTWIVDSVLSFTSHVGDGEHTTSLHIRETTLP
ncbi:hypothetical protein FRC08_016644, partial [Ceratobasidium sp. 394]